MIGDGVIVAAHILRDRKWHGPTPTVIIYFYDGSAAGPLGGCLVADSTGLPTAGPHCHLMLILDRFLIMIGSGVPVAVVART